MRWTQPRRKRPVSERSDGRRIAVVLCVAAVMGAAVLMATARPTRRQRQQNDASLHEAVRAPWRAVVRRARPVYDTARLPRWVGQPSVPRPRPGQPNDAALHEAVRARWRGVDVVRRASPVDDTARLELGVDNTARIPSGIVTPSVLPRRPGQHDDVVRHEAVRARSRGVEVVRRASPVDDTARLPRRLVMSSVRPRPNRLNDAAPHWEVRAHWREAVHRIRPVDDTARLDLNADDTAQLGLDTVPVKPSVPREPR